MTLQKGASPIASSKNALARPSLILASASPRRRELLTQIGVVPDQIIAADIDETPRVLAKGRKEGVRDYAKRMALEKARKIADMNADSFVLGADTVVSVGTRILPKAEELPVAQHCLELISGRSHRVYSGVCIIDPHGRAHTRIVESRVKVRNLDAQAIQEYLDSREWEGKAGGYAIQGLFAKHIIQLIGSYTNVVGLPLYETANLLSGAGWRQSDTDADRSI